jgi:cysteinyl-tRNA synthetase, unknown class
MRAVLVTLVLLLALTWAGLTALERVSDPAAPLAARTGPALGGVKAWGYQLQRTTPRLIPAEIDLLVVDYSARRADTAQNIEALRTKPDGTKRIVLCYLSIGEAENYRAYWQRRWATNPPAWLGPENPAWKGNFAVDYWHPEWQRHIVDPARAALSTWDRLRLALFPQARPYLDQIIEAGFDGVYLDRIDAYEKALETRPSATANMIAFVETISTYAKKRRPGFLVVPQNGEALLSEPRYRKAIDGVGKEDLFYGETGDGIANVPTEVRQTIAQLNRAKADGRPIFVVEYLTDEDLKRKVHAELRQLGYIGVYTERGLSLPPVLPPALAPLSQSGK